MRRRCWPCPASGSACSSSRSRRPRSLQEASASSARPLEQPIPVARGLIYDRKGRLLVKNVPTFVVRVRPSELPFEQRAAVADTARASARTCRRVHDHRAPRRPHRLAVRPRPHRATCPPRPRASIARTRPASRASMSTSRLVATLPPGRRWCPTCSAGPATSPGPSTQRLRDDGYWPEDLIGKAGLEATFEDVLRGTYGVQEVERDARRQRVSACRRSSRSRRPGARSS